MLREESNTESFDKPGKRKRSNSIVKERKDFNQKGKKEKRATVYMQDLVLHTSLEALSPKDAEAESRKTCSSRSHSRNPIHTYSCSSAYVFHYNSRRPSFPA